MGAHAFSPPSTWEAEAGGFRGQPGLQREFQDSQGYTEKACLGKKKKKKKKKDRWKKESEEDIKQSQVVAECVCNSSTREAEAGRSLTEFEASLVYTVSSRTARPIQTNPISNCPPPALPHPLPRNPRPLHTQRFEAGEMVQLLRT
jgi:hypothetical protein